LKCLQEPERLDVLLRAIARAVTDEATQNGFVFEQPWKDAPKLLMYVVTELSEAMEAWRNDDRDAFEEEIADSFIRLMHIVGLLDIPIGQRIEEKRRKNRNRPYRHGRKQI